MVRVSIAMPFSDARISRIKRPRLCCQGADADSLPKMNNEGLYSRVPAWTARRKDRSKPLFGMCLTPKPLNSGGEHMIGSLGRGLQAQPSSVCLADYVTMPIESLWAVYLLSYLVSTNAKP